MIINYKIEKKLKKRDVSKLNALKVKKVSSI